MSAPGASSGAGLCACLSHLGCRSAPALRPSLLPPLCFEFLDLHDRKEVGRLYGMDALRGDKPDNDNLDDVKREVLVSGRPERRSGHVGHCDHATCGRIVFFGVDGTDGALRVAIVKRDETLYLLLRVAHQP